MITVSCHECIPSQIQPLFVKATHLLAERLGITTHDASIELHFVDREVVSVRKNGITTVEGSMGPSMSEENKRRVAAGLPPSEFEIDIAVTDLLLMLKTLAHEMIHLKQWVTRELYIKQLQPSKEEDRVFYYKEEAIPYATKIRPWEKEAHQQMRELGEWVGWELLKDREKLLKEVAMLSMQTPIAPATEQSLH